MIHCTLTEDLTHSAEQYKLCAHANGYQISGNPQREHLGIIVNNSMKMSTQCLATHKKASEMLD